MQFLGGETQNPVKLSLIYLPSSMKMILANESIAQRVKRLLVALPPRSLAANELATTLPMVVSLLMVRLPGGEVTDNRLKIGWIFIRLVTNALHNSLTAP